jgi:hypothetical protein
MYRQILQSIQDVEIWPIVSLIVFFVLFLAIVIKVFLIDKKHIQKMKNMPLDDGTENNQTTE